MEQDKDFVLVDVRDADAYAEEHIHGAENIPLETLAEQAEADLNKNQRVILYGDDHDSDESNDAAAVLENLGFRKISDFDGGLYAWRRAGFTTVAMGEEAPDSHQVEVEGVTPDSDDDEDDE
jgi:rhodanese-related sulfurtransferase